MRRVTLASALLLTLPCSVAAQELLPRSFAAWTAARPEKFTPAQLEALAGDSAVVLREYGVLGVERRPFRRDAASLRVTLYQMRDSTAAYGAFTFLRSAEMVPSDLGHHSATSAARALAVTGNLLFDIAGDIGPARNDLKGLVSFMAARAEQAPYPLLHEYLPAKGIVKNSDRLVLGLQALDRVIPLGRDWIGFNSGAEVQVARYQLNGKQATLVLALYPTPQAAARREQLLRQWFNVNASEPPTAKPVIHERRSSSLVAVVLDAESARMADVLLDQVQYQTQVTWNEPAFKATEPEWATMVVGIFYGTAVFLMFAIISGVALGGIRVLVKRLLPGKVFDRDSSVEILQLGISSKPIEGKDFYKI